jgi:hypothetical protein
MIRILVCSSRTFKDEALVFKTLDQLNADYDGVIVNAWGSEGAGKCARRWAKLHQAVYDELVLFGQPCDLVIAFDGTSYTTVPLRQAWKKRIPGLRVLLDGSHVKIGVGWKALLRQRRRRFIR